MRFDEAIAKGHVSRDEALAIYDALSAVEADFMLGQWAGAGFATGHSMDGLLEACHWYGKRFLDAENVHPLLFNGTNGKLISVDPKRMPMGMSQRIKLEPGSLLGRIFQASLPLLRTGESRARLRMTEYRGMLSATMIYDHLPINDVFRKVDENTVLGAMDMKGMDHPFFFLLRRDATGDQTDL